MFNYGAVSLLFRTDYRAAFKLAEWSKAGEITAHSWDGMAWALREWAELCFFYHVMLFCSTSEKPWELVSGLFILICSSVASKSKSVNLAWSIICSVWKERKAIVDIVTGEKWIQKCGFLKKELKRNWKNYFHTQRNLITSGPFGSAYKNLKVPSESFCIILFQPSAFLDFYS